MASDITLACGQMMADVNKHGYDPEPEPLTFLSIKTDGRVGLRLQP